MQTMLATFCGRRLSSRMTTCGGTLSCSIIIDPKTAKTHADELDYAISTLRWGRRHQHLDRRRVWIWKSSMGAPHQAACLRTSKAVPISFTTRSCWTIRKKPCFGRPLEFAVAAWLDGSKNSVEVGKRLTAFERKPGIFTAPGVIVAALKTV